MALDNKYSIELGKVYGKFGKEIKEVLRDFNVSAFKEYQIEAYKKKIDSIIRQMSFYALNWSADSVTAEYNETKRDMIARLQILKFKRDEEFNLSVHQQTIEEKTKVLSSDLISAANSIRINTDIYFQFVSKALYGLRQLQAFDFRQEEFISGLLDEAIKNGASRQAIAAMIVSYFNSIIGDEKYIRINGRNYNIRKYAKLVARTRIRYIQSDATINSMKEYDADLVEVSNHNTTCEQNICQKYEGRVFSMFGKTKGFPVLDSPPPWHPNCQHNILPTSEIALQVRKEWEAKTTNA